MNNKNLFSILCIFSLLFFGCNPKVQVLLNTQNEISYNATIPFDSQLQETFSSFFPTTEETFINPSHLEELLNNSKTSQNSVTFTDNILHLKGTLLQPLQALNSTLFDITKAENHTKLAITLFPEIIQERLFSAPQEVQDVCEMLMIPLYTEEKLTKEEYLEQIAGLYGKNFAKNLQKSEIAFTFTAPNTLEQVSLYPKTLGIYKIQQNSVTFFIPLTHFITNTEKIEFCIQWKN